MLQLSFLSFAFFRFVNSGFYFDFFLKKISEIFIRNIHIYTALFFGEKFVIEVLTKKVVDYYIFTAGSKTFVKNFTFDYFFYCILLFFFYSLSIFFLFF